MNKEQKELYKEWKRLEIATTISTKIGIGNGHYDVTTRKPDDILNLQPIREKVWKELMDFLSLKERTDLGMVLGKKPEEIFKKELNG